MLKEKIAFMEDFIATTLHEIKNPLNIVLGNLRLLVDQHSSQHSELMLDIKRAFAAGEHLRVMITSTLDWQKQDFRELELSFKEIDTLSFLSNVWTICGSLIRNKNLEGFLRVSKDLPPKLVIDVQRMMQIIINFVTNGVKFTRKGFVSIEFQWVPMTMTFRKINRDEKAGMGSSMSEKVDEEKIQIHSSGKHKFLTNRVDYFELNNKKEAWDSFAKLRTIDTRGVLKIRINDSGCGMSQSQIEALFNKFSQTNPDTEANHVGFGLGLWISKRLIDKLGGSVKANSVPNKGTTFEIIIPIKPPSANSISSIQASSSPRSKNVINLESEGDDKVGEMPFKIKKVLIVDDDKFNVTLLKQWCKKQGYLTVEASNGKEAVAIIESSYDEIGAILMDEDMPEMTGGEAMSLISCFCKEKGINKIPSFCLSGNSKASFIGDCMKAGFDEVMQKPIDYETLNVRLMKAMRKQIKKPVPERQIKPIRLL